MLASIPTPAVFELVRRHDGRLIGRRDSLESAQQWADGWRRTFPASHVQLDVVAWSPVIRPVPHVPYG